VELDFDGTRSLFFIGPRSGGLEIEFAGREVTIITPQSPLGENLMGKKAGQRWTAKAGGSTPKYHIVSMS
jgi:transcription elongation GreA/GreB family factor